MLVTYQQLISCLFLWTQKDLLLFLFYLVFLNVQKQTTDQTISDEVTELAKGDARSWRQDFREEIVEIDAMVEIEVKAAWMH